MHLGKMKEYF